MPSGWYAFARSTKRRVMMPRLSWRAPRPRHHITISLARCPNSHSFPSRRARPRKAGSRRPRRRLRRSPRRASSPTTRPARSARPRREARMIRVIVFLIAAGLLAAGVVWLADRPGQVAITWLGYRADTSVMFAIMAVTAVAIVAVLLWSLVRFLLRSPKLFSLALRERKRRRGYDAISRGLIAIGAGDARAAERFAANAQKSLPNEPLALLLRAQTAQLNGDRAGAEDAFRAMAERGDTRLLGLRGLYVEAQRRNDPVAARLAAEEAAKDAPALPWAGQAVLQFRGAAGDWEGALAILERHRTAGMIDRASYRRQRAVLLTARALAAEEDNRDVARTLAVDAVKIAPDLVPAAALAGRLLAESGERRKAGRIPGAAGKANPHPDLAQTHAHLRLSDAARDRLSRMQALARLAPGHAESALAVARAA